MAQKWGLTAVPLRPPNAGPVRKGDFERKNLNVISRVPTSDRVVFLTIDDASVKDPDFASMVRDLSIPFTTFLSDASRDNYGYFRELLALGHHPVENHTVNHPDLTRLGPSEQQQEICQQQIRLTAEIGVFPRLFRPPFGRYDARTLSAARACGVRGIVLWSVEAFPDRIVYGGTLSKLRPGDIVLTHCWGPGQWHGTMVDMLRRVLQAAADQHLAVAALEDYV
ncbi:polysaccharide deacetylase family protein [Streptomyces sp. NPDC001817]|uniref:polysaccharide deacetylase family protein n=1 Tax=Streptomyces sp. NPDC001817 TaxID=3154398 RepID=UPI00331834E3